LSLGRYLSPRTITNSFKDTTLHMSRAIGVLYWMWMAVYLLL